MILKPSLSMTFNPEAWFPYKDFSRCFAYAVNMAELGKANIGGLAEVVEDWRNYESIQDIDLIVKRGQKDGFIPVNERLFNPSTEHVFATLTSVLNYEAEAYDCHHIRLDEVLEDGTMICSHKPGSTAPDQIIVPPNTCLSKHLLEVYSEGKLEPKFINFFKIPNEGLKALPRNMK